MRYLKTTFLIALIAVGSTSCKKSKIRTLKTDFKTNYANMVHANYEDAHADAVTLKASLTSLVNASSAANLTAARGAWLSSRESYGQTEAYRFANGPIDDADGPEGSLNAWPLDESYIDYVEGNASAGIINNTSVVIDGATLRNMNEAGGETNISMGYHAIEFLLWGQDDANTALETPGDRPYTDFVTGGTGTANNQGRRGEYLLACADLLIEDLLSLVDEWKEGGSYRVAFIAEDDDVSVTNILTGMGVLGKSELAGERIFTALDNQNQEDEHSCFSDNTHRDIILNFVGIENIYRGSYTRTSGTVISGTSFSDIVEKADKKLNAELSDLFDLCNTSVNAIPVPFDNALTLETPGGTGAINESVTNLRSLGDKIAEAAAEIGISINTALPE